MKQRTVPLWQRLVCWLLTLSMMFAYADIYRLTEAYAVNRDVSRHNAQLLKRLEVGPARSAEEVAQARNRARATIAATRQGYRERQQAGLAELRSWSERLWKGQHQSNLAGFSDTLADLTEVVRRVNRGGQSAEDLMQDGRRLLFQREQVRTSLQQLAGPGLLPSRVLDRGQQLLEALEALGGDPSSLTPTQISSASAQAQQLLERFVRENAAGKAPAPGKRHPRQLGNDPLTGRPLLAPDSPGARARKSGLDPVKPWSGEELKRLFGAVPGLQVNARLAQPGTPGSADLAETMEVKLTQKIKDLATSLGKDPRRIFNYVIQNIDFEIYYGSLLGAEGTLEIKQGNDIDQASLLIALLRASGIPARYETGTAVLPAALVQAMTGIQDVTTAASALATMGFRAVQVSGNQVQLSRTWVRAYVPYSNYRSSTSAGGGTSLWVALDPAVKQYRLEQSLDLSQKVAFDVDQFLSVSTDVSALEFYQGKMRDYIKASGTKCETLDQATLHRVNESPDRLLLPLSLPYDVPGTTALATELPNSLRYALGVEATDSYGNSLFSQTFYYPALYGKQLALTYPSGSGVYSSLSGSVKPTLSLDGQVVAQAAALATGSETPLHVSVTAPGLPATYHTHEPVAGGTYGIHAWMGEVPKSLLAAAEDAWHTSLAEGAAQNVIDLAIARVAGLTYHSRLHADDEAIYGLNGWMHMTEYEALAGTAVAPVYYFGVPSGAKSTGYVVDAENVFFSVPLKGSLVTSEQARIAQIAGYNSSFHEHRLWESILSLQALSSTNILQYARQDGQPLYQFKTISEYNAVSSKLKHPTSVLSNVTNALNNGEYAVISERQVTRGSKTMSGYVLYDSRTGAGKYLINAALNGGETIDLKSLLSGFASLFGFSVPTSSMTNLADGGLTDSHFELSYTAFGQMQVVQRFYNSALRHPSELGLGWGWSLGERLFVDSTTGNITRLTDRAVPVPYTRNSNGTYQSPPGGNEVLASSTSGYTITFPEQNRLEFDTAGRLSKTVDRYGNTLLIPRDGKGCPDKVTTQSGTLLLEVTCDSQGLMTKVADADGRSIAMTYTDGQLTTFLDAAGVTWLYTYDASGRLIGKQEGDKSVIAYGYDGEGRLSSYTNPSGGQGFFAFDTVSRKSAWKRPTGSENLFTFDSDARLTERIDPVGNKTSRSYTNGELTGYTNARGEQIQFEYDTRGNLVKQTNVSGEVVTSTYDSKNRLTSRTDTTGTRTYTYDDSLHTTTITDTDGTVQVERFSAQGQLLSRTQDGVTTSYTYGSNGALSSFDDGAGHKTSLTTDASGRVTSMTQPGGETTSLTFNSKGNLTQATLPGGATIQQTFNGRGLLSSSTDPVGNTTSYTYIGMQKRSVTGPDGRTITFERDGDGRLVATLDSLGNRASRVMDGADRVVSSTDNRGNTVEYNFCADLSSTPCDIIDPLGNLIQRTFDARGRLTEEKSDLGSWKVEYADCPDCGLEGRVSAQVDPLGNRTEYTYDPRGYLASVKDALGGITQYTRDGRGLLTAMTDASGAVTTYQRNAQGLLEQVVDELNRLTAFTYNGNGQLVAKTDPNGKTVSLTHGAMGNVASETFEDGSSHVFTFDSLGRKTRSVSADADLEYRYDARGRYAKVLNHTVGEELSYSYDPVSGEVASITRPDGVQQFAYDQFGQLATTVLPDGQLISYRYDALGRLAEKRFPNGNVEKNGYDRWGHLESRVTYARSGAALAGMSYTYDAVGRRVSATDATGVKTTYAYDALGRLTEEKQGTLTRTFVYDAVGNRTALKENGAVKVSYTYDDTHRLLTTVENGQTTTLTYDDNGNVLKKQTGSLSTTFTYDQANRLTHIQAPGKTLNRFKYDAEGRRVYRADSSGAVNILYDREDAALELDTAGNNVRGFAHGRGLDEPLALLDYGATGKTYFYHTDGLGSVVGMSSSSGALVNAYRYDAFGVMTTSQATVHNDYAYTGQRASLDTGTYDFRARQLDPSLGRFLQVDPRGLGSDEQPRTGLAAAISAMTTPSLSQLERTPQSLHSYAYVSNDPMNRVDPSGEGDFLTWDQVLGLAIGVLGVIFTFFPQAATWVFAGTLVLGVLGLLAAFVSLVKNISEPGHPPSWYLTQIVSFIVGYHLGVVGMALSGFPWAAALFVMGFLVSLITYWVCESIDMDAEAKKG